MQDRNTSDTPRRMSGRLSARRIATVCGLIAVVGGAAGLRATGASLDTIHAQTLGSELVGALREGAARVALALQPEQDAVKAQGEARTIWDGFDRDFAQPAAGGSSQITLIQQDGDRTVEVRIVDGETSAKVNGKKVKKDRIVREGSALRVTDEDGNVIAEFHVAEPGQARALAFEPGRSTWWRQPPEVPQVAAAPQVNPPKVMIGVTMSDADGEVAEQLGVSGGVRLDHVYEDLPADEAGLREGDIVISFDGEDGPTTEGIREVLRSKEPGDSVDVVVLRKGKKVELSIELAEYDAEKLGQTVTGMTAIPFAGGGQEPGLSAWRLNGPSNEASRLALEQALKSLEHGSNAEARAALADALKRLHAEGGAQSFWLGQGGDVFSVEPDGRDFEKRMADLDRRLSELDERMAQLDRRLQRVLEALDRAPARGGR